MRQALTKTISTALKPTPKPLTVVNSTHKTGTEPLAHMKITDNWAYSTLEYPLDLQQRSDLGHYMMFYVNVMDTHRSAYSSYDSGMPGKRQSESTGDQWVGLVESPKQLTGAASKLKHEKSFSEAQEPTNDGTDSSSFTPGSKPKVIGRKHQQGRLTKTASWNRKRTTRTTDSIVLYMPPTIQTNTNVVYKGSEMGNLASSIASSAGQIYSRSQQIGPWGAIMEFVPQAINMAGVDLQRAMSRGIGAIVGGDIAGANDKLSNRAQNRYLESLFDNIAFRKFSYTYKFTPKSPEESLRVRDIIQLFKFHMSPELPEDNFGRYFIPPAEFDMFYMFRDAENDFLNKITSCVLTNMDVNYANGRFQTFRAINHEGVKGAPPTEIEMKLDFMETAIITKKEVVAGY